MATVVKGGTTTQSRDAVAHKNVVVNIQGKLEAENDREKPVVYVSTKGADAAFLRSPVPMYDNNGSQIGVDNGVRLEFTHGLSAPFYLSNPIHAKTVKDIDAIIEANYPIVHDLGLEKQVPGAPLPPLVRWNNLGLESIKGALAANFGSSVDDNVAILEQGIRYELSRPKKEQRKDLIQALEGMATVEAAETANDDALDI